jgi:uncharacterized protein YdeI (BOF family)
MKILSLLITTYAAASLYAQNTGTNTSTAKEPGEVQNPRAQDDGSWIALSGTVKSTGNNDFVLDHGSGTITVKLQPENKIEGDHKFIEDEKVRVFGVVDDNFFKATTILARAVYVESLSTFVYRTDGVDDFVEVAMPVIPSGTVVQGRITKMEENKIVLDEGDRNIMVDTSILTKDEDPNTMENTKDLKVGDHVVAVGVMDKDFWTGRTFRATTLMNASGMENGETEEMQGSDRDY